MVRELTPNRWNWSQKDNKWVYIESKDNGELVYLYQINPPKEFTESIAKIKVLNDKLIACKDPEENAKIFREMMKISRRMQFMSKTY
ncbi:MAG: hypothetical protein HWN80_05625 [Candidatus Lokiarchaeota archaeon]|nr:hypothetical protein [Candidatus Lokiarchaeota archaeon]